MKSCSVSIRVLPVEKNTAICIGCKERVSVPHATRDPGISMVSILTGLGGTVPARNLEFQPPFDALERDVELNKVTRRQAPTHGRCHAQNEAIRVGTYGTFLAHFSDVVLLRG